MSSSVITYRLSGGFDDPLISCDQWNGLLSKASSDVIFMTWQWQKAWWKFFGRGKLLIMVAEQNEKPIAIAPLFSEDGMVYFIGSGGSDYLDFIGNVTVDDILENLLLLTIQHVPDFVGFLFYHVLQNSQTTNKLQEAAKQQEWKYFDEGSMPSPMLNIKSFPEKAVEAINKKSLLRHEKWFIKNGGIEVKHFCQSTDILPHINHFFEQHIARWRQTSFPSLFNDDLQKLFYKKLCELFSETGWLRFTVVFWNGREIAFHFGFHYNQNFLWYKPSFDIELSKRSPGEVLLRQLLLKAVEEDATIFDFGLGDEQFKQRFATNTRSVHNWGIYPATSIKENI